MSRSDSIGQVMQDAVARGVFPGAVLAVRLNGRLAYQQAFGHTSSSVNTPATLDTIYDLASLTKPLATAMAVLCLVQDGRMTVTDPLRQHLDALKGSALGDATIQHLLTHSSGLPGWRPLYERIAEEDRRHQGFLGSADAKRLMLILIAQERLESAPGETSVYSDLGFIVLGLLVEQVAGCSLADYCRTRCYDPMHAVPFFFIGHEKIPVGSGAGNVPDLRRIAPTEDHPWRKRVLQGEVHDENAYAMGGVAGHAGLFGTVAAVLAVSGHWLNSYLNRSRLLDPALVHRFVARQDQIPRCSWAMGWDTPSVPSSSGVHFSPQSFGHLGFTGTSLWIDPTHELEVALLSNRVHPTRQNESIKQFRPVIHDVIFEELITKG